MNERVIFDAALEIADPQARRTFVEKACAGNPELLAAVESLLTSHDASASFLETPVAALPQSSPADVADRTLQSHAGDADADSDEDSSTDLSFLQPSTKPGSIGVLGHYEVLQVLGQGAFGIVLKAFDEKLHRLVAIKVMNPQLAATSPPRKRFLREARAAAAIRHENVVQVHSVEEQPLPYMVMEFIGGQTLQQKLDGFGPLDPTEVLHIGRQIAAGLAAAQEMGLIHRDIKPGNILLEQGAEQKVKITDFGLARAADDASLTRTGVISGTPMYMAPEQALGQPLDQRTDLFCLGSVLYQMACGRPPFRAETTLAVLRRVAEDTPRPLQEILPEIPDWLVAIISKLHQKKPADRFQSAKEVADLLGRCQSELQLNGKVMCVGAASTSAPPASVPSVGNTSNAHIPATPVDTVGDKWKNVSPDRGRFRRYFVPLVMVFIALPIVTGVVKPPQPVTGFLMIIALLAFACVTFWRRTHSRGLNQDLPTKVDPTQPHTSRALRTVFVMVPLLVMFPILFGRHLSPAFNAWLWPPIPTLPVTEIPTGLRFDGKDDYVKVGPIDLSSPQYTLEAFVTSAKDGDNGVIALLKNVEKEPELMYLYDGYPSGQRQSGAAIIGQRPYQSVNAPLPSGTRQHRALVVDGQVMHYFVNGIWQGKRYCTARKGLMWQMRELYIGCKSIETEYFRGQIDQLRLSKIARYSNNFPVESKLISDDSTLALYNFDEGHGNVLNDSSGHGYHGKIIGATWVKPNSPASSLPPSDSPIPDRRAAEYVLSIGGRIKIKDTEQRELEFNGNDGGIDRLPSGSFELTMVSLDHNAKVSDASLTVFKGCQHLTDLSLYEVRQVTDVGLANFKDSKNWTQLDLFHTQVTDAGLRYFHGCESLTFLRLAATPVSDAGLTHFQDCKKLTVLDLSDATQVTDVGLVNFRNCEGLAHLLLTKTQVSDAGLANFKDCEKLEVLNVAETRIGDVGMAHLKGLKKLATLLIYATSVSDTSLEQFAGYRMLTFLMIKNTKATEAGVKKLSDALPGCKIEWDGGVIEPKYGDTQIARIGSVLTGLQIGPVLNTLDGIIPRPAQLPGIARWQAVTAAPRQGGAVAWGQDGKIFLAESGQLRTYDAASLELRDLVGPGYNGGHSLIMTADRQSLAWGGRIRRVDGTPVRVSAKLYAPIISPDGKWLAGDIGNNKLAIESVDGTEVRTFDRPFTTWPIWSPDSRRLCVLEPDRTTVSILNLDGTTAASFATGLRSDGAFSMSWSPDGTLLAIANQAEVRIASVKAVEAKDDDKDAAANGKLLIEPVAGPFNFGAVGSLAWSPDSQRLAIAAAGLIFVDRSGKEIARAADGGGSLAWSPDGREIVVGQHNGLFVWTADGKFARAAYRPHGLHFPKLGVDWNRAGTLAVTSDDGTVRLWEPTGQPGPLLDAPGSRVRMATWNPNGDTLLTSAESPNGMVARTWSATGQPGERLPIANGQWFRWHSDGRRVISNDTEGTGFWIHDPVNERPIVSKTLFGIAAMAIQPKGDLILLATSDGTTSLWHDDGTPGPLLDNRDHANVMFLSWHPTESIFAVALQNKGVRIGNADGKWLEEINVPCDHVAWSPDGRWLAMAFQGFLSLRAANGGHGVVYRIPNSTQVSGTITSLAWSPDSRLLAIGVDDHRLIVRDVIAEETKWVVQHLPPQLNAKGDVARHGAAVVFSEAGELLHVAHSVPAKSAGPARVTAEPVVAGDNPISRNALASGSENQTATESTAGQNPISRRALAPGSERQPTLEPDASAFRLISRYAELDGLIFMQVETQAEPGKTRLLKPSEFVKLVGKLAQEQTTPSFNDTPLDQPLDLRPLAEPDRGIKLTDKPLVAEFRSFVPRELHGEYDLSLSATVPAQPEWLGLGLTWRGRPCEFFVDRSHLGLQQVDGLPSTKNETFLDGQLLKPNDKIEIVCRIRQEGITILVNDDSVLEWKGDPARLASADQQAGLGNPLPTLRCSPGWTIHHWTLTPRGQGLSPTLPPERRTPTAVRQLLDDGYQLLTAEHGHGQPFQGAYPANALLPANERITLVAHGPLNGRTLEACRQLPNLNNLQFHGGYLRSEFVPQLNQFTQVTVLYLSNVTLRDENLNDWTLPGQLENLNLGSNSLGLSDGLLDKLVSCSSLRTFQFEKNPASEEALMKLDRVVQLENLVLANCNVTDRVLDRLQTLPNLKHLNINATPTTAARVEAFRQAKPNCRVEWSERK